MINISSNPVLIARMPYGKHKGFLFSEVPRDYLAMAIWDGVGREYGLYGEKAPWEIVGGVAIAKPEHVESLNV